MSECLKTSEARGAMPDFEGLLLGTLVGDALGLPAEGLSPRVIEKRWRGVWKMRLVFGHGIVSDDTEHAVMTALALLREPDQATAFARRLASRLRWWFLALPPGVGLATAKASIRLWLGFGPSRSGVLSAGNGPAMRSALLGAFFSTDEARRRAYVAASTRLTHTDPRAEIAAAAVAEAAACAVRRLPAAAVLETLLALGGDEAWQRLVGKLKSAIKADASVAQFAIALGLENGVTGYAYHTVPVAIYAWLRHRHSYAAGIEAVLNCGGDTDTVGAITGALLGLSCGATAIPKEWIAGVADWPISIANLRSLAASLSEGTPPPFRFWHWLAMPLRNLLMLLIVLAHGFRRLI